MLEIILDPAIEIKDEKDRELYLQFRQLLDTKMLIAFRIHAEKEDHLYSTCINERILENQITLKQFIDTYTGNKPASKILSDMLASLSQELNDTFINMQTVVKEAERRGIIITTSDKQHKE